MVTLNVIQVQETLPLPKLFRVPVITVMSNLGKLLAFNVHAMHCFLCVGQLLNSSMEDMGYGVYFRKR